MKLIKFEARWCSQCKQQDEVFKSLLQDYPDLEIQHIDVEAEDTPWDGYDVGNENETMLKAALSAAGKKYALKATTRSLDLRPRIDLKPMHNKYKFGKRIKQLPPLQKEIALR